MLDQGWLMNMNRATRARTYLSTREAAARLDMALSTVQNWAETGLLPAWKTPGGHRRIPVDAVEAMRARQEAVLGPEQPMAPFQVLVVEDELLQRELYRLQSDDWGLPMKLLIAKDGYEGLMMIGRYAPDVIITDLSMPGIDGFMMIRRLLACSVPVHGKVIVVSGLSEEEIATHGGLPAGIARYPKPIPFPILRVLIEEQIRMHAGLRHGCQAPPSA